MIQIDKYSQFKGCTVYKVQDGVPLPFPSAIDAAVVLPQIVHPSQAIQATGDTDIPDQTRVNAMSCSITVETSKQASELYGYGLQSYVIRAAQEVVTPQGNTKIVGFTAYISGFVNQTQSLNIQVGQSGASDISISVLKYRLLEDGEEIYNVDKTAGILKIRGVDHRERVNSIL